MTMRSVGNVQAVWQPSAGYHTAALAEGSQADAVKAVQDGADEYWADFWERCDSLMVLMVPKPGPAERLHVYRNKPTQEQPAPPPQMSVDAKGKPVMMQQPPPPPTGSWLGQKTQFPLDYAADLEDWISLEPLSLRRDQVLRELAVIEAVQTGQMGMSAPPALSLPPPTSGVAENLPAIKWEGV